MKRDAFKKVCFPLSQRGASLAGQAASPLSPSSRIEGNKERLTRKYVYVCVCVCMSDDQQRAALSI